MSNSSRSVLLGDDKDAAGLGSVAGDHGSICLNGGGDEMVFHGSFAGAIKYKQISKPNSRILLISLNPARSPIFQYVYCMKLIVDLT